MTEDEMTEDEVFVRAYCAGITGLAASGFGELAYDPGEALKLAATDIANAAVDAWRHRTAPEPATLTLTLGSGRIPNGLPEFTKWRNEVDQDHVFDTWTMAFAWLSGRGLSHDAALDTANRIQALTDQG